MTWLPILDLRFRKVKLSGQVHYGEDPVIDIPSATVNDCARESTAGLIARPASPFVGIGPAPLALPCPSSLVSTQAPIDLVDSG